MALITCPECEKQISEHALSCPNCGFQLNQVTVSKQKEEQNKHSFHDSFDEEEEEEYEEHSFHDSLEDNHHRKLKPSYGSSGRKIKETRCKCIACGNTWYYGKQKVLASTGASFSNFGKSMMCCTGCLPAVFIPDSKVTDFNRCSKCGSKNIRKEEIIHEV